MENLEHGWLIGNWDNEREEIGYCENCEKPIYGDEDYVKRFGVCYCECCWKKLYGEE